MPPFAEAKLGRDTASPSSNLRPFAVSGSKLCMRKYCWYFSFLLFSVLWHKRLEKKVGKMTCNDVAIARSRPIRFSQNPQMAFWKPGTVAPGVLIERETEKETDVRRSEFPMSVS